MFHKYGDVFGERAAAAMPMCIVEEERQRNRYHPVPNGPQAEACGSDRVAGNTQSGGLTRDKQSRGL